MPALRMQDWLDLDGIGRVYNVPPGETMESLEKKFFKAFVEHGNERTAAREDVAHSYANLLCQLNPDMATVRPSIEDFNATVAFIRGMVSGYNKDDIEFFLHVPESIRKEIYDKQRQFFEDAGIAFLGWAPSPKTFESIKSQLAAQYGDDWHITKKVSYNGLPKGDVSSRLFIEVGFE